MRRSAPTGGRWPGGTRLAGHWRRGHLYI